MNLSDFFHLPQAFRFGTLGILAAILLSGCATVEKRIKANAEVFSTYPPEVQDALRQGDFEIGYSMEMVEIAKGKPTYVNVKTTLNGTSTIWRYTQTRSYTRTVPVYDVGTRGSDWVDVTQTDETEVLRVEFRDGLVISFEELQ